LKREIDKKVKSIKEILEKYKERKSIKIAEKMHEIRESQLLEQAKHIASDYEYRCVEDLIRNCLSINRTKIENELNKKYILSEEFQEKNKIEIINENNEILLKYRSRIKNDENEIESNEVGNFDYNIKIFRDLIFYVDSKHSILETIKNIFRDYDLNLEFEFDENKNLLNPYYYFSIIGEINEMDSEELKIPIRIKGTLIGFKGSALNNIESIKSLILNRRKQKIKRTSWKEVINDEGPLCFVVRIARLSMKEDKIKDYPGGWVGV